MPTAENARLEYEGGQTARPMTKLTDAGDRTTFNSAHQYWSGRAGFEPVVRPNGILTGGAVTPGSANNQVAVAALTANLNGAVEAVPANPALTISRPATNVARIVSIMVDDAGDLVTQAGTDGATQAFSETRGAAGGPPLIPIDAIEVAQVRVNTSAAAAIAASEIFQVVGLHRETADFPQHEVDAKAGAVRFYDALPPIHTGSVAKAVHASYATPIFVPIALASDFVPAEESYSASSQPAYDGRTVTSATKSLGQASYTAYLEDGVSDGLVAVKGQNLWHRFTPNKYRPTRYMMTQGILGISRTYPAGANIAADCTLTASDPSQEVNA